ncbi:unnamed protein product, partial [Rotaria magnacalcarata]
VPDIVVPITEAVVPGKDIHVTQLLIGPLVVFDVDDK